MPWTLNNSLWSEVFLQSIILYELELYKESESGSKNYLSHRYEITMLRNYFIFQTTN